MIKDQIGMCFLYRYSSIFIFFTRHLYIMSQVVGLVFLIRHFCPYIITYIHVHIHALMLHLCYINTYYSCKCIIYARFFYSYLQ